jgi:hypothetical protein
MSENQDTDHIHNNTTTKQTIASKVRDTLEEYPHATSIAVVTVGTLVALWIWSKIKS